jgi:hypothetical protein
LFQITSIGDNVIVAVDSAEPTFIEHPSLFQPPPSPLQSVFMDADPAVSSGEKSATNPAIPAQSAIQAGAKALARQSPQKGASS